MNNFSYIDRVVFSIGTLIDGVYAPQGTCALINMPQLFVTAAHVVKGMDENLVIRINKFAIGDYQDTTVNTSELVPVKIVSVDPLRDVCVLTFKEESAKAVSTLRVSNADVLAPGETVTVFGFPHSNLGRIVLTQQTCEVGAKILLSTNGVKSKHLVLNIQARPGQSGGPIIRNSDGSLIGLLIGAYVPTLEGGISLGGIDPQTLHQTTHAVSAEYLQEML